MNDSDQMSWLIGIEVMNDQDFIMIDWISSHDWLWLKSWSIRIEAMIESDQEFWLIVIEALISSDLLSWLIRIEAMIDSAELSWLIVIEVLIDPDWSHDWFWSLDWKELKE